MRLLESAILVGAVLVTGCDAHRSPVSDTGQVPDDALGVYTAADASAADAGVSSRGTDAGLSDAWLKLVPHVTPSDPFAVAIIGDVIGVFSDESIMLSVEGCADSSFSWSDGPFEKQVGDAWVRPTDDRRLDQGYYLNGEFMPPLVGGCDMFGCSRRTAALFMRAVEYVQIGSKAPPPGGVDRPDSVAVVEERPLSGHMRITFRFFVDRSCGAGSKILEFDIPDVADGQCCPVGTAGCDSEGPRGGWAPSLEMCIPASDDREATTLGTDVRGCPVLLIDRGCKPDAGM